MNTSETISVNPCKTTLASANSELTKKLLRNSILEEKAEKHINPIDLIFPTVKAGQISFKKFLVPLRSVFSAILIVNALMIVQTPALANETWLATVEFVLGGCLALGLFSRISMGLGAIFFAIVGALAIRSGFYDITAFMLMFGCIAFFLTGSGKYSCDESLRRFFFHYSIKRNQKEVSKRASYKAFSCFISK